MLDFCESRTEENYLNIIKVYHDKDIRTCQVSSNTFKQIFRYIPNSGAWIAQSSPEGSCGIIDLSRFEPEQSKVSKIVFWKYISRKAITNPQGTFLFGTPCNKLDESEYNYDWKSKEHFLGCDYIELSPF